MGEWPSGPQARRRCQGADRPAAVSRVGCFELRHRAYVGCRWRLFGRHWIDNIPRWSLRNLGRRDAQRARQAYLACQNDMKLLIFSDIHADRNALERLMDTEADYYFAAGDLCDWGRGIERLGPVMKKRGERMYGIPGNHES